MANERKKKYWDSNEYWLNLTIIIDKYISIFVLNNIKL